MKKHADISCWVAIVSRLCAGFPLNKAWLQAAVLKVQKEVQRIALRDQVSCCGGEEKFTYQSRGRSSLKFGSFSYKVKHYYIFFILFLVNIV
jgi:hypothetical protein